MAGSATPPNRSHLWTTRSGPASAMVGDDSSSEDESSVQIPKPATTQPKPIPRSAGYGAFLATSLNLPSHTKALMQVYVGRKLLQEGGGSSSVTGQWLGWMMAAIYMGGRIPQIVLNIKRGSVEHSWCKFPQMEKSINLISDLVDSAQQFPLTEEQQKEVKDGIQELSLVCNLCKTVLDTLDHKLREVFRKIMICQTEGLGTLSSTQS